MKDASPGRKKIKVRTAVRAYSGKDGDAPYLLVLDPKKRTHSPKKDYEVEWSVEDDGGYTVRLHQVRPQKGSGTLGVGGPSHNGRKLTRELDVVGMGEGSGTLIFAYDLLYSLNGGEICEALAVVPTELPACRGSVQRATDRERHPPPEIWVP